LIRELRRRRQKFRRLLFTPADGDTELRLNPFAISDRKKNQLQIVEPSILRAATLFQGKNYPTSAASNASVYSAGLTTCALIIRF
jgi:hypothetical protein